MGKRTLAVGNNVIIRLGKPAEDDAEYAVGTVVRIGSGVTDAVFNVLNPKDRVAFMGEASVSLGGGLVAVPGQAILSVVPAEDEDQPGDGVRDDDDDDDDGDDDPYCPALLVGEIREERRYQDDKHGGPDFDDMHNDDAWAGIIKTYAEDESKTFRDRMVKVASVAVAAIQAEDRRFARETAKAF